MNNILNYRPQRETLKQLSVLPGKKMRQTCLQDEKAENKPWRTNIGITYECQCLCSLSERVMERRSCFCDICNIACQGLVSMMRVVEGAT